MARIAVFDLDGTLTNTNRVDADCFFRALQNTFGIIGASPDWSVYRDVTDSGILADIVHTDRGTAPTDEEVHLFIREFVTLLDSAYQIDRTQFNEVTGARSFLRMLRDDGWTVTIATGSWWDSARRKLAYGGFSDGWSIASANDGRRRTDIVRTSLDRAGVAPDDSSDIVIFGDAIWDVNAANDLGLPIIAVTADARAAELLAAGAYASVSDYSDSARVMHLIEQALSIGRGL